jgi:fructokinase
MDVAAATCRFEGALLRLPDALRGVDIDRIGT